MLARLSLTEDLSICHAHEQETTLIGALAEADDLELDLVQVGEIDTAGLQLLILLRTLNDQFSALYATFVMNEHRIVDLRMLGGDGHRS